VSRYSIETSLHALFGPRLASSHPANDNQSRIGLAWSGLLCCIEFKSIGAAADKVATRRHRRISGIGRACLQKEDGEGSMNHAASDNERAA